MSPFDALDFTAPDVAFVAALDAAVRLAIAAFVAAGMSVADARTVADAIAADLWGAYADGLGETP